MSDPYFSDVVLLLHMDGASGSTTFTDDSSLALPVTVTGNTQISTTQSKWGGASAYFDGSADYINLASTYNTNFNFGTGDFTVELWFYPEKNNIVLVDRYGGSGSYQLYITSTGKVEWYGASGFALFTSANSITLNTWQHIAVSRASGTTKVFVDGVQFASASDSGNYSTSNVFAIGAQVSSRNLTYDYKGYIDDLRVTKGVARYTSAFTPPSGAFPNGPINGYVADSGPLGAVLAFVSLKARAFVADSGPLGQPQVFASQLVAAASAPSMLGDLQAVANQWAAIASAPSMLGNAASLAWQLFGYASVPSPLGIATPVALHDFTGLIGDAVTYYVMDLITPSGTVRAPISSWQATLQTGLSNYVQCVVPAVSAYVDTINAATQFVVSRRVVLPGDVVIEYEMARAPVQTVSLDQGPSRYTATISGYSTGFAPDEDPSAAYNRTLQDIRSISVATGGTRVRCSIDWLLRPSHRVYAGSRNFVAAYINYYVGNNDAYMEVGERT